MLARLSVPKASTALCCACPHSAPFSALNAPVTLPGAPSSVACQAGCLPAGTASGKQRHAQLQGTRSHSSGVPCQTGRGDIHRNLLFICKRLFLFPLPFQTHHLCLHTSDSPPTCPPKEKAMITAELDNITSLMPRKPLVCLLRVVSG